MWIGLAKNNETKPLGFKSLGINLSYKHNTKLNIWQTRDLTLFGRTMLVKTLGLIQISLCSLYAAGSSNGY